MLCSAVGRPSMMISRMMLRSGREKRCICGNNSSSKRQAKRNTQVTTACAKTVAMAAPMTPMAGIGPSPKIKSGSSTMLSSRRIAVAVKDVLLFPMAVKITGINLIQKRKDNGSAGDDEIRIGHPPQPEDR